MTNWRLWFRVALAALSERSNQAFYDEIAPIYDQVFVNHRIHAETILDLLQEFGVDRDKAALVLDLGCGTGLLSTLLADQGLQVIGLDISFQSLVFSGSTNNESEWFRPTLMGCLLPIKCSKGWFVSVCVDIFQIYSKSLWKYAKCSLTTGCLSSVISLPHLGEP